MSKYILLGILCVSTFFALVLPSLSTLKNINKDDPIVKEHIKEKKQYKKRSYLYIKGSLQK